MPGDNYTLTTQLITNTPDVAFWGDLHRTTHIYGGNIWLIHPIRSQMLYPLSYGGDLVLLTQ